MRQCGLHDCRCFVPYLLSWCVYATFWDILVAFRHYLHCGWSICRFVWPLIAQNCPFHCWLRRNCLRNCHFVLQHVPLGQHWTLDFLGCAWLLSGAWGSRRLPVHKTCQIWRSYSVRMGRLYARYASQWGLVVHVRLDMAFLGFLHCVGTCLFRPWMDFLRACRHFVNCVHWFLLCRSWRWMLHQQCKLPFNFRSYFRSLVRWCRKDLNLLLHLLCWNSAFDSSWNSRSV